MSAVGLESSVTDEDDEDDEEERAVRRSVAMAKVARRRASEAAAGGDGDAPGLAYMHKRSTLKRPGFVPRLPWLTLQLFEGQVKPVRDSDGDDAAGAAHARRASGIGLARKAGVVKIAVRIFFADVKPARRLAKQAPPLLPAAARRPPREFVVRLYALRATDLTPPSTVLMAASRDPYLRCRVGSGAGREAHHSVGREAHHSVGCVAGMERKDALKRTLNPQFYRRIELTTVLPGPSRVHVRCLDQARGCDYDLTKKGALLFS